MVWTAAGTARTLFMLPHITVVAAQIGRSATGLEEMTWADIHKSSKIER